MREVASTADTPVVAPPRPLIAVRPWRLAIPRIAVDREALLRGLALLALATQVGLTIGLALVVSHRRTSLAPMMNRGGEHLWLTGPLHYIAPVVPEHGWGISVLFSSVLAGTIVCYLAVIRLAHLIPRRTGLGAIGLLHAIMLIAPVFILSDIFNYIDFARLGLLHGINPYTHGAAAARHDPTFPLTTWHHMPTPYGPLFTVGTYALVPLGKVGAYVALKAASGCSGAARRLAGWTRSGRRCSWGSTHCSSCTGWGALTTTSSCCCPSSPRRCTCFAGAIRGREWPPRSLRS